MHKTIRAQLIAAGIIREDVASPSHTTSQAKSREARPSVPLSTTSQPAPTDTPTASSRGVVKSDPNNGKTVSTWLYAAIEGMHPKAGPKGVREGAGEGTSDAAPQPVNVSDDELNQILLDNPTISAATFVNMVRAKGYEIVKKPEIEKIEKSAEDTEQKQADAASANLAVQREAGIIPIRAHFREANAADDGIGPTRFRVVLIQEGLGNLRDGFFYTKEALQNAITVFEGRKIYADHPTSEDEQIRPERSVRDILGHFENVTYAENAEGQGELVGDVVVLPDKPYEWARALLRHSVEFAKRFPDKDFIGLSINASGDATDAPIAEAEKGASGPVALKLAKAKEMGLEQVRMVTRLTDAVSCDLVTEAGAGGKVLQLLEQNKETVMSKKVKAAKAKESEAVETKTEAEGEAAADAAAAGDAGHSDAAADRELIKKMLDEYIGAEEGKDHAEEMYQAGKEALDAAKEAGCEGDEAMKCAGYTMKMAKHMTAKKEAAKAEEAKESDCEDKEEEKTEESADKGAEEEKTEESKEGDVKESAAVTKLQGENAALKERLAKIELSAAIDEMLRESKLPMSVTKKFRESIASVKTKAEAESRFKTFREGYELARGGEADSSVFLMTEKQAAQETGEATTGDFSFADCVER